LARRASTGRVRLALQGAMGAKKSIERPFETRIRIVRGHRVMLDSDLAGLYGVETKALIQAAKRNHNRFPVDFAFILRIKNLHV
jgi:ORF6N domain